MVSVKALLVHFAPAADWGGISNFSDALVSAIFIIEEENPIIPFYFLFHWNLKQESQEITEIIILNIHFYRLNNGIPITEVYMSHLWKFLLSFICKCRRCWSTVKVCDSVLDRENVSCHSWYSDYLTLEWNSGLQPCIKWQAAGQRLCRCRDNLCVFHILFGQPNMDLLQNWFFLWRFCLDYSFLSKFCVETE